MATLVDVLNSSSNQFGSLPLDTGVFPVIRGISSQFEHVYEIAKRNDSA